ncbi:MAG: hypothetical protein ACYCSZ_06625 [Burkholderiales bacterium]
MEFDLLASIELTVSAAIAVSVLAVGFGEDIWGRLRIASGLTLWFVLVIILAVTEVLTYQHGVGAPGLGVAVILPIVILSVSVLRSPSLRRALQTIPLSMLIGVHAIRVLGVTFLILYAAGRLPAPFAPVAGWGDIMVGLAAGPIAWLVYKHGAAMRLTVLVWNILGLLDLVAAIGLGAVSSPGPLQLIFTEPGSAIMTTLPWLLIPGFLVPLLASTHLAVFYRLNRSESFTRPQQTTEKLI